MRKLGLLTIVAGLVFAISSAATASLVPVALNPQDFSSILTGTTTPVGLAGPKTTSMVNGPLVTTLVSQAFTNGLGDYLYLYQVNNFGAADSDSVETMTLSPFLGASGSSILGYLTANAPAGFTLGTQAPTAARVDTAGSKTVSFRDFDSVSGYAIFPGTSSSTMYVVSKYAPGLINGNVIDGVVITGQVVGPVAPEPATLCLLSAGVLGLLRRRKH